MDKALFEKRLRDIEHECTIQKNGLYREFALANNPVNMEDIITDHIGSIKVANIKFYLSSRSGLPMCIYQGPEYTKQGKPFKNGSYRAVYQDNLKTR